MEKYLSARASVSGKGWNWKASVKFATDAGVTYQSNEVLLVAYRDLIHGYDGMMTGDFPPFTPEAKDKLCRNPRAFH